MNEFELDARFGALVTQRNNALNQNVLDSGTIAILTKENEELKSNLDALRLVMAGPTEEQKAAAPDSANVVDVVSKDVPVAL
jgi:hypothetical protein